MGYYVKRKFSQGWLIEYDTWMTRGCGGWSINFRKARRFETRAAAKKELRGRGGEIVKIRACRRCNCTDRHACLSKTYGTTCEWAEKDLCTFCLTRDEFTRYSQGDPNPSRGKP